MPWEKVELTWGDTSKNLPWSCISGGSQTIHAMTRAAHATATDAIKKLQQIAAKDLGGKPEDYVWATSASTQGWRRRDDACAGGPARDRARRHLRRSRVAQRHQCDDQALRHGSGRAGAHGRGKDNYKHDGTSRSFAAAFAEVEVDIETGMYHIIDYLCVADVGTVIHPARSAGRCSAARSWGSPTRSATMGVRPALRRAAGTEGSTTTSRRRFSTFRTHGLGCRRPSRSGNAGGRTRHRRATCRLRLLCGAERDFSRGRRRGVRPRAGYAGSHRHRAGNGQATQARLTANV